jgi:undecaprenyl-diphosphatase
VMFAAERTGERRRTEESVSWPEAIAIGCAQACALVPGVSRSGATIALGMFLGLRRDAAARFTFLLAIPATLAAASKEAIEVSGMHLSAFRLQMMAIGLIVSAIVGYLTIKYFLRFLAGHRLDVFAYYRWVLAAVTFAWVYSR